MTSKHLQRPLLVFLCFAILFFLVFWALIHIPGLRPSTRSPYQNQRYIMLAGGSPDFPFSQLIARGANQAAADLGINIELVWSRWDQQQMIIDIKEAIDRSPDGVGIMGHPGEQALEPLVREAFRKGILITTLNVDLPGLEQEFSPLGFGYVGQDIYHSGRSLAESLIRVAQPKPEDTILVLGSLSYPIRGERTQGILDVLHGHNLSIVYQEGPILRTSQESDVEQQELIRELLQQYPKARFFVDDVNLLGSVKALETLGIPPEAMFLAGFDLSRDLVPFLETGRINLVSDQQPFLQGYLAVLQLVLTRTWGFSGLRIDTGMGIVTPAMLDRLKPYILQGIR